MTYFRIITFYHQSDQNQKQPDGAQTFGNKVSCPLFFCYFIIIVVIVIIVIVIIIIGPLHSLSTSFNSNNNNNNNNTSQLT